MYTNFDSNHGAVASLRARLIAFPAYESDNSINWTAVTPAMCSVVAYAAKQAAPPRGTPC